MGHDMRGSKGALLLQDAAREKRSKPTIRGMVRQASAGGGGLLLLERM